MLSRSVGLPSRNDRLPSIWNTHGKSGNVFVNPTASSSAPHPQGIKSLGLSNASEDTSSHVMSESQALRFKKKVSLEEQKAQKEDRFLRGRQIVYLIYEYFRVTGANGSVENYADLFTVALEMTIFRNSIRNGTKFCYR